jgi:DNA-binding NarL/FixJ family response regulator
MPVDPYHIVLAEDHVMVREGIKKILSERADLKVVGEAEDGIDLLNLLHLMPEPPHLVIVDISMPRLSGIEATRAIKTLYPDVRVMTLTIHKEVEYFHEALSAGADGYLLKGESEELFLAIDSLRIGKTYFSSTLSKEVTADWVQKCSRNGKN